MAVETVHTGLDCAQGIDEVRDRHDRKRQDTSIYLSATMSLVAKPLGVRSMRQILTEELARRRQEIIDQMEMKDEDEGHDIYIENKDDASADGDSCSEQSVSSSEWEDDYGRRKSMFERD